MEFQAKKKERFYNRPLKELKFKDNSLVACIVREGKVILPKGDDVIMADDHIIVVTLHEDFDDLTDIIK